MTAAAAFVVAAAIVVVATEAEAATRNKPQIMESTEWMAFACFCSAPFASTRSPT